MSGGHLLDRDRPAEIALARKARAMGRVILAVTLLDLKTRHGRSYTTYLVAIGWPLSHLIALFGAFVLRTHIAPIGDSPAIFAATGLVPYILCLYPSRWIAFAVLSNRQLISIPMIQPIHLIISKTIVEFITALIVCFVFCVGLAAADVDFMPMNIYIAVQAILASILMGIGLGAILVTLVSTLGPMVFPLYYAVFVLLYIFSGVYVPIWMMSEPLRSILEWNPLLHLVEWLRSAYYTSYDETTVNKFLVLATSLICLAVGLLGDRLFRGKLLA